VTIVENVSRIDQRVFETTLIEMPTILESNDVNGPAVMLYGIKAHNAAQIATSLPQKELAL
jgi:uroporphyrin-III C-methyltransferase/precorrin-2 dehydrogenase/sirohydrochlorin ferrochelatase